MIFIEEHVTVIGDTGKENDTDRNDNNSNRYLCSEWWDKGGNIDKEDTDKDSDNSRTDNLLSSFFSHHWFSNV